MQFLVQPANATYDGSPPLAVGIGNSNLREYVDEIQDVVSFDNYYTDTRINGNLNLGSLPSNPQITFIEPSDGTFTMNGNITGAGILMVKAEEFTLRGNFTWDGAIVVVGDNLDFNMSGNLIVEGGLMLEADTATIKIAGNVEPVVYSSQAITNTKNNLPTRYYYAVNSYREN